MPSISETQSVFPVAAALMPLDKNISDIREQPVSAETNNAPTPCGIADPLALSLEEKALALALLALEIAHFINSQEAPLGQNYVRYFSSLMVSIAARYAEYRQYKVISKMSSMNRVWDAVKLTIPVFGDVFYAGWRVSRIASSTFEQLKQCWANFGKRKWETTRNVVVQTTNVGLSTLHIIRTAMVYLLLYQASSGFQTNSQPEICHSIDRNAFLGLQLPARLIHPDLDPTCLQHAAAMIAPERSIEELKGGVWNVGRECRRLQRAYHPDSKPKDPTLIIPLNEACATLLGHTRAKNREFRDS